MGGTECKKSRHSSFEAKNIKHAESVTPIFSLSCDINWRTDEKCGEQQINLELSLINTTHKCSWSSHSSAYKEYGLYGHNTMQFRESTIFHMASNFKVREWVKLVNYEWCSIFLGNTKLSPNYKALQYRQL
jgi:hypothetical protein